MDKEPGHDANQSLPSVLRLRLCDATSPLPHMSLWYGTWLCTRTILLFYLYLVRQARK